MEVALQFISGNTSIVIYIMLFAILALCGVGLPVPEDIPLVAAGYLAYTGEVDIVIVLIVSIIGIMLGDSIIFRLGKTYGYDIAQAGLLRRVFKRKRLEKAEGFFAKHGSKAVFFGRFVTGVRAATFFIAGMMKMRFSIFFSLDLLAAILSVPVWVLAPYYFGENIDRVLVTLNAFKYYASAVVVIAVLIISLVYLRGLRKEENSQ